MSYLYYTREMETTQFYSPNHGTDCRSSLILEEPSLPPLMYFFSISNLSSLSFVVPFVSLLHCSVVHWNLFTVFSSNLLWFTQSNYLVSVVWIQPQASEVSWVFLAFQAKDYHFVKSWCLVLSSVLQGIHFYISPGYFAMKGLNSISWTGQSITIEDPG